MAYNIVFMDKICLTEVSKIIHLNKYQKAIKEKKPDALNT